MRIHCAVAVSTLGEPFTAVAAARAGIDDPVFALDPSGEQVEAALRAGLRELGRLPTDQFRQVFTAAEAGHDALLALR